MNGTAVTIATLGCRLNQVDSEDLAERLLANGYQVVDAEVPSVDVVVVNTCTVTARADASGRQAIRRAARRHPGARIVVTGCWAQTNPEAIARLELVDVVAGNADKPRLPQLIDRLLGRHAPVATDDAILDIPPVATRATRARGFLKVQDGCRYRCAFCIVPLARGARRSVPPGVVLDRARAMVALGYRELTLTGVDLGNYGADLIPRTTLAAVLRGLVALSGLRWIRLSSVLPRYFTAELIDIVTGSSRIAPHLHVPLQSGSDAILRNMRRPYTVTMYRRLVERLVTARPDLGLGADVIAGFPGETEADAAATIALVESLPFSYLHVFGYSDRTGTAAASLPDRVDPRTVARRSATLRALGDVKSAVFTRRLLGATHAVMVLEHRDRVRGDLVGLTGNYVEVGFEGADALKRTITRVKAIAADAARVRGEWAA